MKNKILISILLTLISLPAISFASINCSPCTVSMCTCQITECSKGVWNIFKISDCSSIPTYRGTFINGVKMWFPAAAATYYANVLCDDGVTRSSCTPIPVSPSEGPTETTTTTTETTTETETGTETTTETTTTTTETTPTPAGGFNWFLIIIIVVIVIAIFFLLKRKKTKKSPYETLYKKWSR